MRYPHKNPLIYLRDVEYKYLNWVLEFIYTGQYNVKEPDLVQFLSVGINLGVDGLLGEIDNNYANKIMENDVIEAQSNEKVDTSFE